MFLCEMSYAYANRGSQYRFVVSVKKRPRLRSRGSERSRGPRFLCLGRWLFLSEVGIVWLEGMDGRRRGR